MNPLKIQNYFYQSKLAPIEGISPKALGRLVNYDCPVNIRELINILEATVNFCRSGIFGTNEIASFLLSE